MNDGGAKGEGAIVKQRACPGEPAALCARSWCWVLTPELRNLFSTHRSRRRSPN